MLVVGEMVTARRVRLGRVLGPEEAACEGATITVCDRGGLPGFRLMGATGIALVSDGCDELGSPVLAETPGAEASCWACADGVWVGS